MTGVDAKISEHVTPHFLPAAVNRRGNAAATPMIRVVSGSVATHAKALPSGFSRYSHWKKRREEDRAGSFAAYLSVPDSRTRKRAGRTDIVIACQSRLASSPAPDKGCDPIDRLKIFGDEFFVLNRSRKLPLDESDHLEHSLRIDHSAFEQGFRVLDLLLARERKGLEDERSNVRGKVGPASLILRCRKRFHNCCDGLLRFRQ